HLFLGLVHVALGQGLLQVLGRAFLGILILLGHAVHLLQLLLDRSRLVGQALFPFFHGFLKRGQFLDALGQLFLVLVGLVGDLVQLGLDALQILGHRFVRWMLFMSL